ncbi:MAG: RagB/SusD family nutrient uptake outer membrane protein [Bacteroidota bacterium]|jgi:hypothetical protein|nr:RagB/SusD family nutrient uptake outer membrane protein [Bacteroidota bacterium]
MKKIITLLTLVVAITLGSCSDFLHVRAYDFVSPEEFYQNENDAKMALAGVYSALAMENMYGNRYSCMISNVDDLSFYARPAANTSADVYGNGHNTSNTDIYYAWNAIYKGIESANILIERIDGANIDESVKTRIKGEAKFLRAYYHFLLVQAWKDVPIRKESFKDVSKSTLPATPMAEALDWVIEEMEECLPMVDNKEYDKRPSYVKKTVVEGVLARVALTRAGYPTNGGKPYYEMAARYAKSVKDSNKHRLNPDVYEMWKCMASDRYDTEYNESMWEVEFIGARELDGNYTESRIGNVIGNVQRNGSPEGLGYSYWFYCGSLILWDLYDNADKRRDLSMAPYSIDANDKYVDWRANQIVQRACGKFRREWETITPKHKNYTQINYPLIRYADVLLMLAEAENEANQGPTALAYQAINIVRERAGIEPLSGLSYSEFQQELRNERGRELCFESLRKYDLVRWGIYTDAIAALGEATYDKRWPTGSNYSTARAFAERTQKKHEFLPIPVRELSINTELTQNPLW